MNNVLVIIRVVFVVVCAFAGWLVCYTIPEWDPFQGRAIAIGFFIGMLTVLTDLMLKGFSLRGLSVVTFGLGVGVVVAFLIGNSPLFEYGDEQVLYLVRIGLFLISTYLATVVAMRAKDEFQLVIPYVRFVPHEVDVPLVVVDTSALIDGRIVQICKSQFLSSALIIPEFVVNELQKIADSREPGRQQRGRRGLDSLNQLRELKNVDLRVVESAVGKGTLAEEKLIYLAQSMKAHLLTTDYTLAQRAQFQGVSWLNMNALSKALHTELQVGEHLSIELVKPGREPGQGVGFVPDGSMVVVDEGSKHLGETVNCEVTSIIPSGGGKMIFARLLPKS